MAGLPHVMAGLPHVMAGLPHVMAGLDPAICRGTLSQQCAATDGRVKPGHDGGARLGAPDYANDSVIAE